MWVNVKFYNSSGTLLKEIGKYGPKKDRVLGKNVTVPTVLDPEGTRVYEILMAMSETQAKAFGKKPGKSFFFVLNDTIAKDNRIPPQGFSQALYDQPGLRPVGATYLDGQYWDDTRYHIPGSAALAEYQLSGRAKYAITQGDLNWINENVGELTQKQLMFIYKRLEREAW